jgi:hypothetical protein
MKVHQFAVSCPGGESQDDECVEVRVAASLTGREESLTLILTEEADAPAWLFGFAHLAY